MDRKIRHLDRAAAWLADLIGRHLAGLSPAERKAKSRAFKKAVAKIDIRVRLQY